MQCYHAGFVLRRQTLELAACGGWNYRRLGIGGKLSISWLSLTFRRLPGAVLLGIVIVRKSTLHSAILHILN